MPPKSWNVSSIPSRPTSDIMVGMKYADMTREQKKVIIARVVEYKRRRVLTPEQIEARRKYDREWKAERRRERRVIREANRPSPEQRKAMKNAKSRERWRNLSTEEKKQRNKRNLERIRNLTPEQKERRNRLLREWESKRPQEVKERCKEVYRRWCRTHPQNIQVKTRKRRAAVKGAEGSFTVSEWLSLVKSFDNRCARCKRQAPEIRLTIDHILPVTKGGSNYISNIQPLCVSCNSSKKDKVGC